MHGWTSTLALAALDKPKIKVDGILKDWQRGGAKAQRRLLGTLFDALVLQDGQIVEYVPGSLGWPK